MGIEENPPLLVAHSPEEFIFQIDSLLQNYDISLNLGKKARQLVETKYSWQVFAKRYLNFYHTVEKNPRKHNEQHISIESDPFWLQETIEKGRFADNRDDPHNIYLLGKGEKIAVPADAPDLIDRIKQFLKDY